VAYKKYSYRPTAINTDFFETIGAGKLHGVKWLCACLYVNGANFMHDQLQL